MKTVGGVLLGAAVLMMAGCGGSSKKDLIVGKWKSLEQKDKDGLPGMPTSAIVEFSKDGTLKVEAGPFKMDGKYKFIDDNNVEMTLSALGQTKSQKMKIESITKDKMVTVDEQGKREEMTRVP